MREYTDVEADFLLPKSDKFKYGLYLGLPVVVVGMAEILGGDHKASSLTIRVGISLVQVDQI